MELSKYVGKVVKVELSNGYFYKGTVEKADDDGLFLIDINGKPVDIAKSFIVFIKEVGS